MGLLVLEKEKPEVFYAAIGRALTVWSGLENDLCTLFCRCVGTAISFPANHAFWAVVSFDAKLKMTDAAMTSLFPEGHPIFGKWVKLKDHLHKKNRKRNEIAHGTLVSMPHRDKRTRKTKNDLFFAPYFWGTIGKNSLSAHDPRPGDRMYVDDIRSATQKFSALQDRLKDLAQEVFEIMHGAGFQPPTPSEKD